MPVFFYFRVMFGITLSWAQWIVLSLRLCFFVGFHVSDPETDPYFHVSDPYFYVSDVSDVSDVTVGSML